jgi:hypothetical protein
MPLELSVSHYNPPVGKEPPLSSWDELVETLVVEQPKPSKKTNFSPKPSEASKK